MIDGPQYSLGGEFGEFHDHTREKRVCYNPIRISQIDSLERLQQTTVKYVPVGIGHGYAKVEQLWWELLSRRRERARKFKVHKGKKLQISKALLYRKTQS